MTGRSHLLVSRIAQGITIARLNRPDRLNALSEEMGHEIIAICEKVNADPSCRGLIFTGNERAFSTGRDLKLSGQHSKAEAKSYLDVAINSVRAVAEVAVPTCAAIDGHCLGWGFELTLGCDFRVVSKTSALRFPETALGLFPGAGE